MILPLPVATLARVMMPTIGDALVLGATLRASGDSRQPDA